MNDETLNALNAMFSATPVMRSDDSASENELDAASERLRVQFPSDYREFVMRYGGAMVGPYPVFGLRPVDVMEDNRWSVVEITESIRDELPFALEWVVFSEDHSGNPIGFDTAGRVFIFDHDFGGETQIADSFESYIRSHCLKMTA
ncbi:SMI1/KNR4 family protein [Roseiconus lacunae]|uniref:SMI1/KNR4 family protein n=1 Tax=Roseiconus lacunae TaxID=2605694 RepID=UPI00308795E7|nr:SMI1/KNR4 family protein [Stieleria sp. HD01]